jgi:large subunit ribosomal protein L29
MAAKDMERKAATASQLRELTTPDLEQELTKLREAEFRLRFRAATEDISAENPMRFRTMRRNIARIRTILSERAREQA